MDHWVQWVYVVLIVLVYASALGALLLWERFRTLVVGYGKHRRGALDEPVVLPYFVALWAAATMGGLAGARDYMALNDRPPPAAISAPTPPAPYVVRIPGALGNSAHAFFSFGWHTGLAVFGITVDTWGLYAVVCVYQLTRAVLGSMVNNIFIPFYNDTVNSRTRPARNTIKNSLVGLGLVRVFMWWSTITDILISASQLDLALFTLVATVAADLGYGFMRITDIECVPSSPPMGACGGGAPVLPQTQQQVPPAKQQQQQPPPPQQQQHASIPMIGHVSTRRRSRSPATTKSYGGIQLVVSSDSLYNR